MPSWTEGVPRVVLEAMGTCTPVIASRVGGIPDALLNGRAGYLVNPGKPDEIVESVNIMDSNPVDLTQKVNLAYREAKKYTFSSQGDIFAACLRQAYLRGC